ncbi:MAG: biotin synthase [Gammaproteobacteria bacterium]|jgi:biotin synthase|nr:biotin synthase [Gammaproteobacteria bacterium]
MNQSILIKARALFKQPLLDLIFEAHSIHRQHHIVGDVQKCSLLSIKTGGCPENCSYCPQSAHYDTGLTREKLFSVERVTEEAQAAKKRGASRFCMGAAWRSVKKGEEFERVLNMVRAVKNEGLEVCVTLGMLDEEQAQKLKEAGVYAYNHNLDTSREYYPSIITTRTFDDRLETLRNVRKSGMTICSGGIIGMGESDEDRCSMLAELASLDPQPESVPINLLMPAAGTPLADRPPVDPLDLVRMVAVARILIPKSRVRLSAGRMFLNREAHVLAFMAGANSIFLGDTLLTCPNPNENEDEMLLTLLAGKGEHEAAHEAMTK